MIFKYLLANDYSVEKLKKFDIEFRQHKTKIDLSTNIDVFALWAKDGALSDQILENATYSKEQIDKLNNLKNFSLYSFIHDGSNYIPSNIIKSDDVDQINMIAEYRIKGTEDLTNIFLSDLNRLIGVIAKSKNESN